MGCDVLTVCPFNPGTARKKRYGSFADNAVILG